MTMTRASRLILGLLLITGASFAQLPPPPGANPTPPPPPRGAGAAEAPADAAGAAAEPAPEPAPPPKPKPGDAITLKDGTVIDGVQIIKESPKELLVEVIENVTLAIPQAQIKSVQRDNIGPLDLKRQRAEHGKTESSSLIPGMKFAGKLSVDISSPPANFTDADLATVLQQMGERAGIAVVLDPSVEEALPPDRRKWSYQSDGTAPLTLFSLLNEELPKQFPDLQPVYLDDKVVVATKAAIPKLKEAGAVEIPGPGASGQAAPAAEAAGAAPAPAPEAPPAAPPAAPGAPAIPPPLPGLPAPAAR